jgi:hypothetical protein
VIRLGEALAMLILVAWFVWSFVATGLYFSQRRLLKGLDHPMLLMSRRDRRKAAVDLLNEQLLERSTGYIHKERE